MAHGEGNLSCSPETLLRLKKQKQIAFTFCRDDLTPAYGEYPWNPNGSLYNIAALCNREGNVLGIQPHPERSFFKYLHPDWTRSSPDGPGDGRMLFESVLEYVERKF